MVNIWSLFDQIIDSCCALCHAPGHAICADCLTTLPLNTAPCALPLPLRRAPPDTCAPIARRTPAFDRVVAPLLYQNPVDGWWRSSSTVSTCTWVRSGNTLGTEWARTAGTTAVVGPVPAGPQRLRERGFNQAAELARGYPRHSIFRGWQPLIRASTPTQRGLPRPQRRRNIRGVFGCAGPLPDHLALIDDVMTTGATAGRRSRALKSAGVKRVEVWAVARTQDRWNRGPGARRFGDPAPAPSSRAAPAGIDRQRGDGRAFRRITPIGSPVSSQ